jgi:acetyl esterase/lipase
MKNLILVVVAMLLAVVVSACGGLTFLVANAPAHFGDFDRDADIAYGTLERQKLDVYRPHGAKNLPVIVFWHGGGWTDDNKNQYRFVGAALANAGYVAVVPNYRLYPQTKFPGFVDDAVAAFGWVRKHAAEIGGDPAHIFVAGHSAGAHIAAMVAYDNARLASAGIPAGAVRGCIGLSGPYALEPNDAELREIFGAPYSAADWQPVRLARAGAPPALLLHGEDDDVVEVAHARKMDARLRELGVPVKLVVYAKRGHSDTVAAFARPSPHKLPVLAEVRAFVDANR